MSKTKLLSSFCTASNLIFHDLVENQPKNCELAKIPASFLVIEAEDFKDAVRRRETHWLAGVGETIIEAASFISNLSNDSKQTHENFEQRFGAEQMVGNRKGKEKGVQELLTRFCAESGLLKLVFIVVREDGGCCNPQRVSLVVEREDFAGMVEKGELGKWIEEVGEILIITAKSSASRRRWTQWENDLLGERLGELMRVCGEVIYDVVAKERLGIRKQKKDVDGISSEILKFNELLFCD